MSSIYENMSPRRLKAVQLMAAGWTISDIAKELNFEPKTISNWRLSPEFRAAVQEVKMEMHSSFVNRMGAFTQQAADRLQAMVSQEVDAPITYADQLKAIKMILDVTNENMKTEALRHEVEQLRNMLNQIQGVDIEEVSPSILGAGTPNEESDDDDNDG